MMRRHEAGSGPHKFDVVVIGGGITGAAVVYEAASRGLKAALFEKGDFAQATSAASSKLIHGGLRYLSNLECGLVRRSLRERRILENIAPNFVYPLPMIFPHYKASLKSNKWMMKLGLTTYDLLAFDKRRTWDTTKEIPAHRSVSAIEARTLQPVLKENGLTGAVIFHDCLSIFPERLALAFIQSAIAHHAVVANYTEVSGFCFSADGRRIRGVTVTDHIMNRRYAVATKTVVNCAGPWADYLLDLARPEVELRPLQRSEGIHVITRALIRPDSAVSTITPGGRHCFLIPWRNHTLIGTTDTPYDGHPDDYRVTRARISELIAAVNASFEGLALTTDDVVYAYGGLRPLVQDADKDTYHSSRRYEIRDSAADGLSGLLTVEGGKWTTSRHLAQKVIDHLWTHTRMAIGQSVSAGQYLSHCAIRDMAAFEQQISASYKHFSMDTVTCLGRYYGTAFRQVLAIAESNPHLAKRLNAEGEILAQVAYAIRNEMAQTLLDILLRRTGIATLGHPGGETLEQVAAVAAAELNWNDQRRNVELETADRYLQVPA